MPVPKRITEGWYVFVPHEGNKSPYPLTSLTNCGTQVVQVMDYQVLVTGCPMWFDLEVVKGLGRFTQRISI